MRQSDIDLHKISPMIEGVTTLLDNLLTGMMDSLIDLKDHNGDSLRNQILRSNLRIFKTRLKRSNLEKYAIYEINGRLMAKKIRRWSRCKRTPIREF